MSMDDEKQARHLQRFFQIAPGQYVHGNKFIGLQIPQTRLIVKEAKDDAGKL